MSIPFIYVLVIAGTVLGAFASYFFKGASSVIEKIDISSALALARNKRFILGVVLYLIAAVNNIYVLGYLDYAVILPMASLTYIWTMIIAHNLLGEDISRRKIAGVALIVIGALVLANG